MQDKIVVDVNASLHANKDVLTEHLVKVIVPISRSAKGVLNIETPVASLSSTNASLAYPRATTTNGGKKKHYPVFFRFPMDSMGFSEHISSQTSLDSIQCIQWVEKKTLSRFFFAFQWNQCVQWG